MSKQKGKSTNPQTNEFLDSPSGEDLDREDQQSAAGSAGSTLTSRPLELAEVQISAGHSLTGDGGSNAPAGLLPFPNQTPAVPSQAIHVEQVQAAPLTIGQVQGAALGAATDRGYAQPLTIGQVQGSAGPDQPAQFQHLCSGAAFTSTSHRVSHWDLESDQ